MKNKLYVSDVLKYLHQARLLNKTNLKSCIYFDTDEHLHIVVIRKLNKNEKNEIITSLNRFIGGVDNGK